MTAGRERWKPVEGFEFRYEVSSAGRGVRRVSTSKGTHAGLILKTWPGSGGHPKVALWRGGRRTVRRVCDLVALAFKGARKPSQSIHFRDGDPKNTAIQNITYRQKAARNHS